MNNKKVKLMTAVLSLGLIFSACSNEKSNDNVSNEVKSSQVSSNISSNANKEVSKNDQGMVEEGSIVSEKLKQTWKYNIYLPSGYDKNSSEKYPVLYMLHGMGENSSSILDKSDSKNILDNLMKDGKKMIVVYVDGFSSFFVDSQYDKMVETAITEELVKYIDENYNTSTEAKDRAIGGVSVGGYGAGRLALRHSDLFSSAFLISPTLWQELEKESPIRRNYRAFSDGKEIWSDEVYKENFPTNFVDENSKNVKFYIASSEGDETIKIEDVEKFAKDLEDKGVSVEFKKDGKENYHDWDYWTKAIKDGYSFVLEQFK